MATDLDRLPGEALGGLLAQLETLPGSYEGPDGLRTDPYGLTAFGEASGVEGLVRSWIDAPVVVRGTQFVLAGGFEFGDLGPLALHLETSGAEVVTLGRHLHQPTLRVEPGPLAPYTYAAYLAHATGHPEALEAAEAAMRVVRDRSRPGVPVAENPAKALAWALWGRVPLVLAPRRLGGLPALFQRLLGRVGKSLAIALPAHPLEVVAGAFEAHHPYGDDVVALRVGGEDRELELAQEVLATRVAQVEELELGAFGASPPEDPAAEALALWYAGAWVAAYLALLAEQPPEDNDVYRALIAEADRG